MKEKIRKITIKGIPEEITEEQVYAHVAQLIQRHNMQQLQPSKKKIEDAQEKTNKFIEDNINSKT